MSDADDDAFQGAAVGVHQGLGEVLSDDVNEDAVLAMTIAGKAPAAAAA